MKTMSVYLEPHKIHNAGYWLFRLAIHGDAEAIKLSCLTSHHLYQAKLLETSELLKCIERAAELGDIQAWHLLGGISKHGLINTNDKVVCIDDTDFDSIKHDAPNGLLQRGRVYCVAGWSRSGGLVLVGLPCIWKEDGDDTGFKPRRFLKLECFRTESSTGDNIFP
jgi:hypothetical protein